MSYQEIQEIKLFLRSLFQTWDQNQVHGIKRLLDNQLKDTCNNKVLPSTHVYKFIKFYTNTLHKSDPSACDLIHLCYDHYDKNKNIICEHVCLMYLYDCVSALHLFSVRCLFMTEA